MKITTQDNNSKFKATVLVRIISIILISAFVCQNITWAYPDSVSGKSQNTKLAPQSFFTRKDSIEFAHVMLIESLIENNDIFRANPTLHAVRAILEKHKNEQWLVDNMDFPESEHDLLIRFASGHRLRYYDPSELSVQEQNKYSDQTNNEGIRPVPTQINKKYLHKQFFTVKLLTAEARKPAMVTKAAEKIMPKVVPAEDFADASARGVAERIRFAISNSKGKINLVLTQGNTMVGFLRKLAREGGIDWSRVNLLQMAEYKDIPPDSAFAFRSFLQAYFLDNLPENNKVPPENIYDILAIGVNGYRAKLASDMHPDIIVLGLGMNGHVGLNEPGSPFESRTREVKLTDETIRYDTAYEPILRMNSKTGRDLTAYTVGMAEIASADHIFLLVNGGAKREIIARALYGAVSDKVPASMLQTLIGKVTVILDREAAFGLPGASVPVVSSIDDRISAMATLLRETGFSVNLSETERAEFLRTMAIGHIDAVADGPEIRAILAAFKPGDKVITGQAGIEKFERLLQNGILDNMLTNDLEEWLKAPNKPDGDEEKSNATFALFSRFCNVFKMPLIRERVEDRKRLLMTFILINIRTPDSKIGSQARSDIAKRLTMDQILFNKDPEISEFAIEAVISLCEEEYYLSQLYPLLRESEDLPRFAMGIINVINNAEGDVARMPHIEDKDKFFVTASGIVKKLVKDDLEKNEGRYFTREILEYSRTLMSLPEMSQRSAVRKLFLEIEEMLAENRDSGQLPKGSCASAIATINANEKLRNGEFTKDEFQKAREEKGDPASDATVYSELNGLIALGILEIVNDATKPYDYRLTDNYRRAPPETKRKITIFVRTLPARPNKALLDKIYEEKIRPILEEKVAAPLPAEVLSADSKVGKLPHTKELTPRFSGFKLNWSTPEMAIESIRFILKRKIPYLMEKYSHIDKLTEGEKEGLRNRIYGIKSSHFIIWGLHACLNKKLAPYFSGIYVTALIKVFPKLNLNPEIFKVRLTPEKKTMMAQEEVQSPEKIAVNRAWSANIEAKADEIKGRVGGINNARRIVIHFALHNEPFHRIDDWIRDNEKLAQSMMWSEIIDNKVTTLTERPEEASISGTLSRDLDSAGQASVASEEYDEEAKVVMEDRDSDQLPKGSYARAIVTINANKKLRNGKFTKDEFQKARKKSGDPSSDTTIYSELNGLITLRILEIVDDATKPYYYRLTDNYKRAPPETKRKITIFVRTLPARPDKALLNKIYEKKIKPILEAKAPAPAAQPEKRPSRREASPDQSPPLTAIKGDEKSLIKVMPPDFSDPEWQEWSQERLADADLIAFLCNYYAEDVFRDDGIIHAIAEEMGLDRHVAWQLTFRVKGRPITGHNRTTVKIEATAVSSNQTLQSAFAMKVMTPFHFAQENDQANKQLITNERDIDRKFKGQPLFQRHFDRNFAFIGFRADQKLRARLKSDFYYDMTKENLTTYFQLNRWVNGETILDFGRRVVASNLSKDKKRELIQKIISKVIHTMLLSWKTLKLGDEGLAYDLGIDDIMIEAGDGITDLEDIADKGNIIFVDANGGYDKGKEIEMMITMNLFLHLFKALNFPDAKISSGMLVDIIFDALGPVQGTEFLQIVANAEEVGYMAVLLSDLIEGDIVETIKRFLKTRQGSARVENRDSNRLSDTENETPLKQTARIVDPLTSVIIHDLKNRFSAIFPLCHIILGEGNNSLAKDVLEDLGPIKKYNEMCEKVQDAIMGYFEGKYNTEDTMAILKDGHDDLKRLTEEITGRLDSGGYDWTMEARKYATRLMAENTSYLLPLLQSTASWLDNIMSAIDVEDIIRESVVSMQESHWLSKDIKVNIELTEDLRPARELYTHKLILQMALEELMHNASKYSKTKKLDIVASLVGEGELKIDVIDYGAAGIPPENLSRIFAAPGFTTAANRITGTGYGLYALKETIESMGGVMEVESKPGRTRCGFTLPINAPLNVVRRPMLTEPVMVAVSGLKGSGRQVISQWLAAKLGLRYIDSGFLARVVLHEMLKGMKDRNRVPSETEVAAFMEKLFNSKRLHYSVSDFSVDGIGTTAPDDKGGPALKDIIKAEIDKDAGKTRMLHDVFAYPGAKREMYAFFRREAAKIKKSGEYNGIVLSVTDPSREDGVIDLMLDAPAEVRALRTNMAPDWIKQLDKDTGRSDMKKLYPDVRVIDTTIISRRTAEEALRSIVLQLPSHADRERWLSHLSGVENRDSDRLSEGGTAGDGIGKFIEIKPVSFDKSDGLVHGVIKNIDKIDTKEQLDLSKINQKRAPPEEVEKYIQTLESFISENSTDSPQKQFLNRLISLFRAALPQNVIITQKVKAGFFGTGKPDFIVINGSILDDPISFLHEIAEYLKHSNPELIRKDMHGLLNEEGLAWLKKHEAKYASQRREQYFSDNIDHYIIRAFTRQVFKVKDRVLTQKVKAEQELPLRIVDPLTGVIIHDLNSRLMPIITSCQLIFVEGEDRLLEEGKGKPAEDLDSLKDLEPVKKSYEICSEIKGTIINYLHGKCATENTLMVLNDDLDKLTRFNEEISGRLALGGYKWSEEAKKRASFVVKYNDSEVLPLLQSTASWLDKIMSAVDIGDIIKNSLDSIYESKLLSKDHLGSTYESKLLSGDPKDPKYIKVNIKLEEDLEHLTGLSTHKLILQMALKEFMFNASKYGKTEKLDIVASLVGEGELKIDVIDYGAAGIPPENLSRIFAAPGFTTAANKRIGTGYGLYSLKETIESMGGVMEVESKPGRTRCSFTLPINAPLDVVRRPMLTEPVMVAVSGLKGSGRQVISQWLAAKLGLRYIDSGFLARVVLHEMLKGMKDRNRVPSETEVAAFMEELFTSGRLHYSVSDFSVDGIDTTAPDDKGGPALKDIIKAEIDKNAGKTRMLHDVFAYPGAKREMYAFFRREAAKIKKSGKYNGIVLSVTNPSQEDGVIDLMLDAPAEVRALRTNMAPDWIKQLDKDTGRSDMKKLYPDVRVIDTTIISRRTAEEALRSIVSQLPTQIDKERWLSRPSGDINNWNVYVLAGGYGTRMGATSERPKPMVEINGKPMHTYVLDRFKAMGLKTTLLTGFGASALEESVNKIYGEKAFRFVEVDAGEANNGSIFLPLRGGIKADPAENIMIANADDIYPNDNFIREAMAKHSALDDGRTTDATVLTVHKESPRHFGRIIRNNKGDFIEIVEHMRWEGRPVITIGKGTPNEREMASGDVFGIKEVNTNVIVFKKSALLEILDNLEKRGAEFVITEVLAEMVKKGMVVKVVPLKDEDAFVSCNTSEDIVAAEEIVRAWAARAELMNEGKKQTEEPNAKILAKIHALVETGDLGRLVKDRARILLSENLFIKDGDETELAQVRTALAPLLKSGYIEIMNPDDMKKAVTNRNASKNNLAIVLTREDFDNKELWIGTDKETSLKSSLLILDGKLTGNNYLYLEGVISLAQAIMANNRQAIRTYYELISGVAIDDEILGLLSDDSQNNVAFAIRAILIFKSMSRIDPKDLDELRIRMENFLIAA